MTVAISAAVAATLGVVVTMLMAKRARVRSNRRFEALLRQLDESLGAIAQTFRSATNRSDEARNTVAQDRDLTPEIEELLEQIVADGAAVRAFKHVAGQVVPEIARRGRSATAERDEVEQYGYEAELARKVSNAHRTGRPLALVVLDLGDPGASEDDSLPAELAALLARVTRATDTVCRRRFSELGVLLPETTAEGARRFHGRVREEMARAGSGQIGQATCAVGIAEWRPNERSDAFDARARAAADRTALDRSSPPAEMR